MRIPNAKVIENDAIVVICFRHTLEAITHHQFRLRAQKRGFDLSKSQCHNMLHRATGRVVVDAENHWRLTVSGEAYRQYVIDTVQRLLHSEVYDASELTT